MIYRSILRFHVRAGKAVEFEAAYDAGEFLTRAADVPGFIRADLLRQDADDHEYVAMAEWENKEAYLEWQDRIPKIVPAEVLARISAVLDPLEAGNVYAVLQSVSAE
ncbi:antibiotic biosynthesis monooxygenase [Parvibaculaceae bacterium PLY_AMNH_Bact1]|nr:antibiotic biosynthesis monooxygenase [Parvibaculaceae bacterium PLY_AMNH_Bact1]